MNDKGSDQLDYPEWQKPVQEALLEFDADQLQHRITAAEDAISSRLRTLNGSANGHGELQAIQDAFRLLAMLKERRSRLG
jgi:hypothetical protein